jgi:chromate transporter
MSLMGLFFTFFYIGLFTIGGGMVAITMMQQTIVDKGLITQELFYNMIAISESTPGPIGVNMATYIGYSLYGVPGGMIATFGEVAPSLIIIMIIAHFLQKFKNNSYVQGTLSFLRPVSTGLILVPTVQILFLTLFNFSSSVKINSLNEVLLLFNWINICAYSVLTFVSFKFNLHPILIIIAGAVFGICVL